MFGFGKTKTPEEKLTDAVMSVIRKNIQSALEDLPAKELEGTYIQLAIQTAIESLEKNNIELSRQFGVPLVQVIKIIDSAHKNSMEYFFE